jgi:hypothetical protein
MDWWGSPHHVPHWLDIPRRRDCGLMVLRRAGAEGGEGADVSRQVMPPTSLESRFMMAVCAWHRGVQPAAINASN